MKIPRILTIALFALVPAFVQAFELGGEISATNVFFPWTQIQASGASSGQFPLRIPFFGGTVYGTESLSDNFSITASYQLDPVLRSLAGAILRYTTDFAELSVGPIFGVFNSASAILKSGISSGIKLEYPGLVYLGFRSDSSIGAGLTVVGDYIQESSEINAGFYVPNAICSLNMISKSFQQKASATTTTADTFTEYSLKIDIFKKNVPYNMLVTFGYQSTAKTFTGATTQKVDRLGSVVIGTRLNLQATPEIGTVADIQANVYTFGLDNLLARGPSMNAFMFRASLGMSIKIGEKNLAQSSVFGGRKPIGEAKNEDEKNEMPKEKAE
jgi:hypothetical protein